MANGMVINPKAVLDELQKLREMGITDYQLFISDRASVVMPYHIELDGAYESLKKGSVIGTTNKGIGPAYADKYNRTGIRIGDLLHKEYLRERLDDAISMVNIQMRVLRRKRYNLHTLCEEYAEYGRLLSPYICDTSRLLYDEVKKDSRILFEGAQGVMLCIEHGTYPFVTSSSPATISVPLGTGIPPKYIDHSLGICKAYNTRVGSVYSLPKLRIRQPTTSETEAMSTALSPDAPDVSGSSIPSLSDTLAVSRASTRWQ